MMDSTIDANFDQAVSRLVGNLMRIDQTLMLDSRANPEDQLKVPVSLFLEEISDRVPGNITVVTEHRQTDGDVVEGVRLDMAVKKGRGALIGHIELKSTSKSANPYRKSGWTNHDRDQWTRLEHHPNLLYCNGWEWTLVRHGLDRPLAAVALTPNADGVVSDHESRELRRLLTQFLSWKPIAPSSPRALADQLAPLTSFLRDSVVSVLEKSEQKATGLPALYQKWQADLIPGATFKDFADSFAQTFTYALLLARIESNIDGEMFTASAVTESLLRSGHRLIGSVLELMAQPSNREHIDGVVSLLESTIGAVDPAKLSANSDPWLYFYEDFLAAYDPRMRNDAGVYYTPVEIVRFQVRLLDDILVTRFGKQRGLGDSEVNILDPAAGTGAYPLAVAERVLSDSRSPQSDARDLAKRLFGFELLVGPYSVAHLRLTQMLEQTGVELGRDGVQIFLTNTLTDPGDISGENQQISFWEIEQNINEETRRAGLVKNNQTRIRVILGNPPYDRGSRAKTLGTGSERFPNVILEEVDGRPPLLNDFIEPLQEIGAGGQAKNLYNSYVYFIRWAIWKACEQHRDEAGVVSFITSSSYLRGPGFAGMREYMRRVFDELWIVDLGGEGRGARKEENVFNIQTPVAIFFGIQWERNSTGTIRRHSDRIRSKSRVNYLRLHGTAHEKLTALKTLSAPDGNDAWTVLKDNDWHSKFVPETAAGLAEFAPLDWVFPWRQSGAQFKRKWPIAPTQEALVKRWNALFDSGAADPQLFVEDRDLKVDSQKSDLLTGQSLSRLSHPDARVTMLHPARYGYRSFDRQWCLPDHRVGTYIRQQLWDSYSDFQLYFATLTSTKLGNGPAITVSPYVPDMHFFRNRGAKDVHPLYRSDARSDSNISGQLLQCLESYYGERIDAEGIAAYIFGLLGTGAYYDQFTEELEESAARVPFTKNYELFQAVCDFGRELIFEQTWGERFFELNEFGQPTRTRFKGTATVESETPPTPYPNQWNFDSETEILTVGEGGVFANVSRAVMEFNVSGMNVVGSWLGYRMKTPAGRSSSPLDQIQSDRWDLDRELLELLWQVEFFVQAEGRGSELLEEVVTGELIPVSELGPPEESERKAPSRTSRSQETLL